jgi:hypothetical protein
MSDPSSQGRLVLNGIPSTCEASKECPGAMADFGVRHADVYSFLNGASNACVTVSLTTTCALYSAVFTNTFDPRDLCRNYLADPGRPGLSDYSFEVGPGAAFVVIVSELNPGSANPCGDYILEVRGGSCVPRLDIALAATNQAVLKWPTFAPDFRLTWSSVVSDAPKPFHRVTNSPIVLEQFYTVTNTVSVPKRFYRLEKP